MKSNRKGGKSTKKKDALGSNYQEIKEVESSENSENDSADESPENKTPTAKQETNNKKQIQTKDTLKEKQDNKKKKAELQKIWKVSHVLTNILHLLLKEMD